MSNKWKYPIQWFSWIEVTRPFHITAEDILNMKTGTKIDVLCLDRNVWDCSLTKINKQDQAIDPLVFFKNNYFATYIHDGEFKGKLLMKGIDEKFCPFEFDFEYEKDSWYPLTNGQIIVSKNESSLVPKGINHKHYKDFGMELNHEKRRVGWRGPMILVNVLKYMPKIYWYDENKRTKVIKRMIKKDKKNKNKLKGGSKDYYSLYMEQKEKYLSFKNDIIKK